MSASPYGFRDPKRRRVLRRALGIAETGRFKPSYDFRRAIRQPPRTDSQRVCDWASAESTAVPTYLAVFRVGMTVDIFAPLVGALISGPDVGSSRVAPDQLTNVADFGVRRYFERIGPTYSQDLRFCVGRRDAPNT